MVLNRRDHCTYSILPAKNLYIYRLSRGFSSLGSILLERDRCINIIFDTLEQHKKPLPLIILAALDLLLTRIFHICPQRRIRQGRGLAEGSRRSREQTPAMWLRCRMAVDRHLSVVGSHPKDQPGMDHSCFRVCCSSTESAE